MRSRQRNEGDLSPFDACDVREKIHLGVPAKEKSVRGVVNLRDRGISDLNPDFLFLFQTRMTEKYC